MLSGWVIVVGLPAGSYAIVTMRFSGSLIDVGQSWLFRVIVVVLPRPSVSEIQLSFAGDETFVCVRRQRALFVSEYVERVPRGAQGPRARASCEIRSATHTCNHR